MTIFNIPTETEYVFNVTDPLNVKQIIIPTNLDMFGFGAYLDTLTEYVCVRNSSLLLTPSFIEQIPNQNLHGYNQADLIIVSHPSFLDQAERLAQFHVSVDTVSYTHLRANETDS